jgi:hypothetical protein
LRESEEEVSGWRVVLDSLEDDEEILVEDEPSAGEPETAPTRV